MKRVFIFWFCAFVALCSSAQKNNLDYFVTQAVANSPLLKEYSNQIRSFALDSGIIRATLRPQVNGISNNYVAPVFDGWGYDPAITNFRQVSGMIQVSKSFLSSKSIASQMTNLQLQSQAISNNAKISEQDVIKAITDQYIVAFGEQLQLDFNYDVDTVLRQEDSLLKVLTRNNVFKQADYLAFAVTVQQQELITSQLEVQYRYDYAALNYLAGIIDTTVDRLQDPQLTSKSFGDFTTSIFYRQFVLDSLKLANDRMLVQLNYRPKIGVFADAGYNSSLIYKSYQNFGTSFGLTFSIPIYDGRQKKMQYAKIDLEEQTRSIKRDYFFQQRSQQILQFMQQLNATNHLIDQINKQITYSQTLITVNHELLATGDIRLTDFILSLNNYITARYLLTQNYINRLKIINQLNYWSR